MSPRFLDRLGSLRHNDPWPVVSLLRLSRKYAKAEGPARAIRQPR
eukprot:CAMPEP_0116889934 /NCGR_PEP_ID=MMETSP0467-20121206/494_1 /TAXON_ID=283647 /ORGANISM="Mesodinium pulex, Strain SPMC105" /LENGTH=44 /DNA_ID= /DNA_START= /DNA_END= /DNA_ORIENTATION=